MIDLSATQGSCRSVTYSTDNAVIDFWTITYIGRVWISVIITNEQATALLSTVKVRDPFIEEEDRMHNEKFIIHFA